MWDGTTAVAREFVAHALVGHFAESVVDLLAADSVEAADAPRARPVEAMDPVEEGLRVAVPQTLGTTHVFAGPLKDNRGVERVKAGAVFPLSDLGKMDWLVDDVVGESR